MSSFEAKALELIEDRAAQRGFKQASDTYAPMIEKLTAERDEWKERGWEYMNACDRHTLKIAELEDELLLARSTTAKYIEYIKEIRSALKIPQGFLDQEIGEFISEKLRIVRKRIKKGK